MTLRPSQLPNIKYRWPPKPPPPPREWPSKDVIYLRGISQELKDEFLQLCFEEGTPMRQYLLLLMQRAVKAAKASGDL